MPLEEIYHHLREDKECIHQKRTVDTARLAFLSNSPVPPSLRNSHAILLASTQILIYCLLNHCFKPIYSMLQRVRTAISRLSQRNRKYTKSRSNPQIHASFDHLVIGAGVVGLAAGAKLSNYVRVLIKRKYNCDANFQVEFCSYLPFYPGIYIVNRTKW